LKFVDEDIQVIVGGKIRSEAEHKSLLSKTGFDPSDNRVVFTDFLNDAEVRALYQLADCLVFPTRADTFPLVVLEAMVSRLPVISTTVGGIPSQIDDSCGILVKPDSPKELAAAIKDMLKDESRRKNMGECGFNKVKRLFNWQTAAELAVCAYNKIVSAKK